MAALRCLLLKIESISPINRSFELKRIEICPFYGLKVCYSAKIYSFFEQYLTLNSLKNKERLPQEPLWLHNKY